MSLFLSQSFCASLQCFSTRPKTWKSYPCVTQSATDWDKCIAFIPDAGGYDRLGGRAVNLPRKQHVLSSTTWGGLAILYNLLYVVSWLVPQQSSHDLCCALVHFVILVAEKREGLHVRLWSDVSHRQKECPPVSSQSAHLPRIFETTLGLYTHGLGISPSQGEDGSTQRTPAF